MRETVVSRKLDATGRWLAVTVVAYSTAVPGVIFEASGNRLCGAAQPLQLPCCSPRLSA